ncbi:MAG: tetratricopeptide repeat protein, partial [Desulfobacula sp.]|nr:tetratricopeptide repeat protein [Desulfobacula sp.]
VKALYNRGLAKNQLKDYSGAIEDYNKAIKIDPVFVNAFYNRGLAKSLSGDEVGGSIDRNIYNKLKSN